MILGLSQQRTDCLRDIRETHVSGLLNTITVSLKLARLEVKVGSQCGLTVVMSIGRRPPERAEMSVEPDQQIWPGGRPPAISVRARRGASGQELP